MDLNLFRFNIRVYDKLSKRLRAITDEEIKKTYDSLEKWARLVKDAPFDWFLVGGLGIDMHVGRLTRFHHDLDIEIPSAQACEISDYMKEKGYTLYRKLLTTNISSRKRMMLLKKPGEQECSPESLVPFRLIKNTPEEGIVPLFSLSYIDVSFSRQGDVGYKGKKFTLDSYEADTTKVKDFDIKLRNPIYHYLLKKDSTNPVDIHDRQNLEKILAVSDIPLNQTLKYPVSI